MAGDWIKMRSDLFTHPKVVRISSALKADMLRTVGGLMSAWCLFDAHSSDGKLDGYTLEALDELLRWTGFAAAMVAVGWLHSVVDETGSSLVLPEFDTHNGQSAKRRAQESDRKRNVRKASALDADKKRTREEKRREESLTASLSTDAHAQAGPGELPADQARGAVLSAIALKKIGVRIQPQDPTLLALVSEKFTVAELALIAAEKALKDVHLWNDPDTHPELHDLLASGATQAQMNLTTAQFQAVKSAAACVGISYIASTLRGRRRDAADSQSPQRGAKGARKHPANENFEGKKYVGTPVDQLAPDLRAAVERELNGTGG
ncbi:hypothetical protein [Rhodanobacter sp. B04]|uniref:hypothetical protein n=1 Tax=Rhodanobacter sp. B04 TaxID=1945860 RepID=UPI001C2C465B|nr:hypothetical protein [Rhodanobacter sp. B04]